MIILFSYSDIFYEKKIINSLIKIKSKNIVVPININWKQVWKTRKKIYFKTPKHLR